MLDSLPTYASLDGAFFVHDNPLNPGDCQYVLGDKINKEHKISSHALSIEQVFQKFDWSKARWVFHGHTHFAGVYTHPHDRNKIIANPGSVGIPRWVRDDKGLETSYAVWNTEAVGWASVRIEYLALTNWQKTGERMEKAGLPNKLKRIAQKYELIT
jgi:hypothetical protein